MCANSGFDKLGHGIHLCSIYKSKEEQLSAIIAYIKDGLLKGDKFINILTDETRGALVKVLSDSGVDLKRCNEWGQFVFLKDEEFYLGGGRFDPERIMQMVAQAQQEALLQGFGGLRGIAETDCFLSGAPGTELLIEYESKLNYFFPKSRLTSICHYKEDLFDEDTLLGVLYTHPRVILYGKLYDNPYYIPPESFSVSAQERSIPGTYRLLRDSLINDR